MSRWSSACFTQNISIETSKNNFLYDALAITWFISNDFTEQRFQKCPTTLKWSESIFFSRNISKLRIIVSFPMTSGHYRGLLKMTYNSEDYHIIVYVFFFRISVYKNFG